MILIIRCGENKKEHTEDPGKELGKELIGDHGGDLLKALREENLDLMLEGFENIV
jgi:hypothetical protein